MEPVAFPSSAVGPMLEGYCDDFISLAASLAQTLEQVTMRKLPFDKNRESLTRVERGMRDLADAIGTLLQSTSGSAAPTRSAATPLVRQAAAPAPSVAPAPARPTGATTTTAADPPVPTPALEQPPGRIVMQGGTSDLPIASVFQFLGQTRKTGTLRVEVGREVVTFQLAAGKIEASATDRPPATERLGDLLVELGFLSQEQIEANVKPDQALGSELLRSGLLDNNQLLQALRVQMRRRYDRVAAARDIHYVFYETTPGDAGKVRVSAGELRAR